MISSTDAVVEAREQLDANIFGRGNEPDPSFTRDRDNFEQAVRQAVLAECVCGHAESEHGRAGCHHCQHPHMNHADNTPWEHVFESREAALARLLQHDVDA